MGFQTLMKICTVAFFLTQPIAFANSRLKSTNLVNEVIQFEVLGKSSWQPVAQNSPSLFQQIALAESKESPESKSNKGSFLDWIPNGHGINSAPPECDANSHERSILQTKDENSLKQYLRHRFAKCGGALSKRNGKNYGALIKAVTANYDFAKHPNVFPIRAHFKTGEINRGFLALKTDGQKRPLVIVKCGIFCDAENDSSVRIVLMHLFDESPFHVLMVGNHTGSKNINTNGRVNIGGFYEGLELFALGHWLKKNPFLKDFISEIHGAGISLGGNASLFASIYNEHNKINGNKVFQSFLAYCPVVRLKPSLDHLFSDRLRKTLATKIIWDKLKSSYHYVEDIQNEISPHQQPDSVNLPNLLGKLAFSFLSRFQPDEFALPFKGSELQSVSDLWVANDFLEYADQITTPTLVMASDNDPVVKARQNTLQLESLLNHLDSSSIMTVRVPHGSHCAKSISYNWNFISATLRGYFLKYSPDSQEFTKIHTASVRIPQPRLDSTDVHVAQIWLAKANKNYLQMTYKTYSPYDNENDINCEFDGAFDSHKSCYEYRTKRINYSQLPFPLEVPQSHVEAQSLTRWLNANLELASRRHKLNGSKDRVRFLRWRNK